MKYLFSIRNKEKQVISIDLDNDSDITHLRFTKITLLMHKNQIFNSLISSEARKDHKDEAFPKLHQLKKQTHTIILPG